MVVTAIYGVHWGDEGKGKIVDMLAENYDIVARWNGGPNAGHTTETEYGKIVLHQVPSGILRRKECMMGNGMVIDPHTLLMEIEALGNRDVDVDGRMYLSDRAHLILPYYKDIEGKKDEARGIGTTKRGIGVAYTFKPDRVGIRVCDVYDDDVFKERVQIHADEYGLKLDADEVKSQTRTIMDEVLKSVHVVDTPSFFREHAGANILLEGAQGVLLGIDEGTYPYCTSSNPSPGGAYTGLLGVPPIECKIGVMKAYITRVGGGPFPTELVADLEGAKKGHEAPEEGFSPIMADEVARYIRVRGQEYGATTGRPRRVGWFDGVATLYSNSIAKPDAVALTKLDVLDGVPWINVCEHYTVKPTQRFPSTIAKLDMFAKRGDTIASYNILPGWAEDTRGITDYGKLPKNAKDYIKYLEKLMGIDIEFISTGPGRDEVIRR